MATKWKGHSNLQSFLDSTAPSVPLHKLSKSWCRDLSSLWQSPPGQDTVDYFNLRELWDQYNEWSAYGVGVPINVNKEWAVEYYVPYLSAVQIFTYKAPGGSRNVGEASKNNSVGNASECRQLFNISDCKPQGSGSGKEDAWQSRKHLGHLYFEYFESSSPYGRIPLLYKVQELAKIHPGLTSFRSSELSPASWMSVAWYPIYNIPTRHAAKELCACFLTYHTISSAFQGYVDLMSTTSAVNNTKKSEENKNRISLRSFGLATYKLQGTLWTIPESRDRQMITCLFGAANSWLKQLKVQHPDFNYFTTHFG